MWWFSVSNVFVRRMLQQKVIVWVDRLCAELSQGLGHVATALHPGVWGTTVIWTTVYWTLSKTRPQPSTQTCMLSTLVLDHIPNLKMLQTKNSVAEICQSSKIKMAFSAWIPLKSWQVNLIRSGMVRRIATRQRQQHALWLVFSIVVLHGFT